MKEFIKSGNCKSCKGDTEFSLHLQIFANGSKNFVWVCKLCDRRNPSNDLTYFIPHEKVKAKLSEEEIEQLPILMPDCFSRCAVCGNRNAELHHWAPLHLFGSDAEKWPKDYLCKSCHDQWHRMVTPGMSDREGA